MKKITCQMCSTRKVEQQEWKTEKEKMFCLTCFIFLQTCEQVMSMLQNLANDKKIKTRVTLMLEEGTLSEIKRKEHLNLAKQNVLLSTR